MKILLILSNDTKIGGQDLAKKINKYGYAPTTLTTLASLVSPELDAEIEIIDEGIQVLPEDIKADIVGISICTPNAQRGYRIADKLKRNGIAVVLGGVHPTLVPEEALQHADAIVIGYAEEAWPKLLLDFRNKRMKRVYEQFSMDVFENGMPIPRRDLLKREAYIFANTIEVTRGCLNQCKFCVIPRICGGKFYFRPTEEVVKEIQSMNAKDIVFIDSNPTVNLQYIKSLYQALIPLKINWFGSATTQVLNDSEWLDLAVKSGCKGLLIGFESLNQNSLENDNKEFNRVDRYKEFIKKLHDYGIAILGCFVFGFNNDDKTIFEKTIEFVDRANIDVAQYTVYTPYPGTIAYEELKLENRIIEDNWALYDGKHVVFQPAKMTAEELQEGIFWAWKNTYTYGSIIKRVIGSKCSIFLNFIANLGFKYYGKTFISK